MKKVIGMVKFQIVVGKVMFVFLVGMVFGLYGVNIMDFCKVFNVKIVSQEGFIILVVVIIYVDWMLSFIMKILLVVVLLKCVVSIVKGFGELNCTKVGMVIVLQVEEIVKIKMFDFNCKNLEGVVWVVFGMVCFMGLEIEG